MERLTKRQREILEYLDDAYPYRVLKWEILSEFDDGDTRIEIKILEEKKVTTTALRAVPLFRCDF